MLPPDLINMFAVPFAFSRYPAHARLNPELRRHILDQERSGTAGNPRPLTERTAATFESHFNLFREGDAAVQELKTFCWDQLLAVIGRLNGYDLQTLHQSALEILDLRCFGFAQHMFWICDNPPPAELSAY